MKKRIFLLIATMMVLACIFALSVSAEVVIPEFTDVIDVTVTGDGVVSPIDTSNLGTAAMDDNTSKVLLIDENGNYATYLSKYITQPQGKATDYGLILYFDALNTATGKSYTAASIVRFEIPEGIHRVYSTLSFSECTSMITVKASTTLWINESGAYSKCSSLKIIDYSQITSSEIKTTTSAMFANNSSVEEVRLPKNLVSMGKTAFHNDGSLKRVYIPSTFTTTTSIVNTGTGKCAFFYTGDIEKAQSVFPSTMPTSYTVTLEYVEWDSAKSDDYYVELAQNHSDKYVIYIVCGYSECNAFYYGEHLAEDNPCVVNCNRCQLTTVKENPIHNECITISYANGYNNVGSEATICTNAGCPYSVTKEAPALFTCLGYSAQEYANGGISVSFVIDHDAIETYEAITGNTLKYGLFAVAEEKLGTNEIMNAQGQTADGVASVEFSSRDYDMFSMRIIGFETAVHKSAQLAIGAYVIEKTADNSSVSYLQASAPATGNTYHFVSFNNLTGYLPAEE
ncbi:MAG: leucine-rich repeat protein [Clostridia bacterium]|nr:leucine-rich repeat protein [Clostridia bacterium]